MSNVWRSPDVPSDQRTLETSQSSAKSSGTFKAVGSPAKGIRDSSVLAARSFAKTGAVALSYNAWLACYGREVSKFANALMIFCHPLVLAAHNSFNIRRKVLHERFFIGLFCDVFATLTFVQNRAVTQSRDSRHDVGPGTMKRPRDRTGRRGLAAKTANLHLQFNGTLDAPSRGGL
jgi:hypothetical protein